MVRWQQETDLDLLRGMYPFSLSAPDQGDRATAPGSSEGAASPNSLA
jgi:hypothetical protein